MTRKSDKKALRRIARDIGNHRGKRIGFVVTLITLVFSFAIIAGLVSPNRESMAIGALAAETVTAPSDITDTVTTEQLKQIAENAVVPVYMESSTAKEDMLTGVSLFFSRLENARGYAEETYIRIFNSSASKRDQIETLNAAPGEIPWPEFLSESDLKTICSLATLDYSETCAVAIASLSQNELTSVSQKLLQILSTHEFELGVMLTESDYKQAVKDELAVTYFFSEDVLSFANLAVDDYVIPYIQLDEETTSRMKAEARESVSSVVYKQGQNITVKGEVVTEAQYAMLEALGLAAIRPITASLYLSLLLFLALVFFGFFVSMSIFEVGYFKRFKLSAILALIMLLAVAVMTLSEEYQSEVMLTLFAVIMCTVLVGRRIALSFNMALTLVFAAIIVWEKGQVSALDFERIMLVALTGFAVPLFLKNASHRSAMIQASFLAGLVGVVTIVSLGILCSLNIHDIVARSLWVLFACLVNGIIAIGLLPLFETIFGMATQAKLLELSNTNRKVLQRLMLEAPGTFYHSSMVANLAERAADALGANGLLVRVAALYHDIGKLENPLYFTENISEGNMHEGLSNIESAGIIIGHVEESVRMAKADGLPRDVIEIISQHHGNALIPNFYYKEKEVNPKVDEDLFRYPFDKPSTKEAGILMIADTVEAALRSAGEISSEHRRDRVNSLVVEKFNHGLLDDCPLTRKELGICANIFTITLENASHKRVKYKYNLSGQVQK